MAAVGLANARLPPLSSRRHTVTPPSGYGFNRVLERYDMLEKIGEGAYGIVYKARNRQTGGLVALKRIRIHVKEADYEGIPATALREITILRKLRCPNVVALDDVNYEEGRLLLVFEHLDQDLRAYMDSSIGPEGMDPRILLSFANQMIAGLAECHSRLVLHRDLKPQNLLVDKKGNLKLADFGLARIFQAPLHKYTHEVVTLWYRAPEILLGSNHYCTAVDMWAAACIIVEMSNLTPLFRGDSEIDQLFQIFGNLGTPNENTWPGVTMLIDFSTEFPKFPKRRLETVVPHIGAQGVDLLERLFTYDPCKRLTAKEALDHPFFFSSLNGEEGSAVSITRM